MNNKMNGQNFFHIQFSSFFSSYSFHSFILFFLCTVVVYRECMYLWVYVLLFVEQPL